MDEVSTVLIALGLLYGTLWVLRQLLPAPYGFVMHLLRRIGRRIWNVAYRIPASQRGMAFGMFWLGCIVLGLTFIGVLAGGGRGFWVLIVFGLLLVMYRALLGWWERRVAARVQRPLPNREQW
jgi:hypothetical protein